MAAGLTADEGHPTDRRNAGSKAEHARGLGRRRGWTDVTSSGLIAATQSSSRRNPTRHGLQPSCGTVRANPLRLDASPTSRMEKRDEQQRGAGIFKLDDDAERRRRRVPASAKRSRPQHRSPAQRAALRRERKGSFGVELIALSVGGAEEDGAPPQAPRRWCGERAAHAC